MILQEFPESKEERVSASAPALTRNIRWTQMLRASPAERARRQ